MIVRIRNSNGGPCDLLGPLVKEYARGSGQMVRYRRMDREADIPKRLVHLEPCRSCPDHPRSRFPQKA
jgi:hypothetical protein